MPALVDTHTHRIELNTSLGSVTLDISHDHRIFVDNVALRANDVEVYGNLYLWRQPNRRFSILSEKYPTRAEAEFGNTCLMRADTFDDVDDATRTHIVQTITREVNEWASKNADAFARAVSAAREDEISRLRARRRKLRGELREIQQQLTELESLREPTSPGVVDDDEAEPS